MKQTLRLLRIGQWIKNVIIFFPLFFAGEAHEVVKLYHLALGFLCFSVIASGIYILNDLVDRPYDAQHPVKKNRPLASNQVNPGTAVMLCVLLLASGLVGSYLLDTVFSTVMAAYVLVNLLYTFWLKQIAVIDVLVVGLVFVMRIVAGGLLANVFISNWIIVITFLLALFLALAKRREDVLLLNNGGASTRKGIEGYTVEYVNALLVLMAGVVIVAYIMYTISPAVIGRTGSTHVYLTAFFVIAGLMKYLQLTMVRNTSGDPGKILFRDPLLLILVLGWLISFYLILY